MTYEEQIQYYADLLITQYRNKPAAQATIQILARESMIDNLPLSIQDAFNVDTAIGVQLDALGKYAGVSREVLTFTGGVVLSDSDYRTLIRMALLRNNSNASLKDIDDLLNLYLGNALIAFDHADMSMGYFFNAKFGSLPLAEALVRLNLLPKPMGVQLSSLIYAGGLDNLYGWASYSGLTPGVTGFNDYNNYTMDTPWLDYADAISF